MKTMAFLACTLMAVASSSTHALNILLTNDDGFAAPNLRALHTALVAAGHSVIVAAPCQNQSGKGGSINFLRPILPLTSACRGGTVAAGAPGAGEETPGSNVFYVDGTPVMAMLYGLDVLAQQKWGQQPDLVISGPNEGNNTGLINASSGTVNNAVYAINRQIPAIAVSADQNTTDNTTLAPEVADIVAHMVDSLQGKNGLLIKKGTGLNINLPKFASGEGSKLPVVLTQTGYYTSYSPKFVAKLSDDPVAVSYGLNLPYPGISFNVETVPQEKGLPSEGVAITQHKIAVSIIDGNFSADLLPNVGAALQLQKALKK